MILVDTSIIIPLLDASHGEHARCRTALVHWAGRDRLAVSAITYGELATGRTREAVDEDLQGFERMPVDFDSAWLAGQVFRRRFKDKDRVLPDFIIRAQAAVAGLKHLTNDRRNIADWPTVEFLFPK